MRYRFLKHIYRNICFTVSFLTFLAACRGCAQDFFAGGLGGISFDGGTKQFYLGEAYGGVNFPVRWHFYSNWYLQPGADLAVGCLNNESTSGFIGALGPLLEVGKGKFPLTLEVGAAPTYLSRYKFPTRDFGEDFQFASHIGLDLKMTKYFTVGWRFQHMSNAHLASPNPGVNMEILSLRLNF